MRLLLLNQYASPDPSPTARLLRELADFLRAQGHEVETISQGLGYHGRPAGGGGRMRRELQALTEIFRAGWLATRRKPDVILALSSPPGLLVVAAVLAWWRGIRLAHWAMDLYPELAVALGEIGRGAIFRLLSYAMGWAYRRCSLIVALDEDMRAHLLRNYAVTAEVLAPWPTRSFERQAASLTQTEEDQSAGEVPWTWLYSGNLGRAHEWRTLLDAQRLLEARGLPIRLVFQGDGAARAAAQNYAAHVGLRQCEWRGYVAEADLLPSLLRGQLLVVTQRPETRGLLWPSKLAVLLRLPRPILYVGPSEGAIATLLRTRGDAGVFAPGEADATAAWIEEQTRQSTPPMHRGGGSTVAEGCATLERWLTAGTAKG